MHKTREAAIEQLKNDPNVNQLLIIDQDERLQAVLAGWRFIEFSETHGPKARGVDGKSMHELVGIAWDGVEYDRKRLDELFGSPTQPLSTLRRAIGLGIGYPDGSIHPLAEQWLATKVKSKIQGMNKRKT